MFLKTVLVVLALCWTICLIHWCEQCFDNHTMPNWVWRWSVRIAGVVLLLAELHFIAVAVASD